MWPGREGKDYFVLSGGGAKGAFQWGVLSVLNEVHKIQPDAVWGTSVGALNGYAAACHNFDLIDHIWRDVDSPKKILRNRGFLGFVLGDAKYSMEPMMKNYIRPYAKVSELKVPFFPVAVDLMPGRGNKLYRNAQNFNSDQELWAYMHGSAAIPGVFEPSYWNGRVLVDGGALDVVPAYQALVTAAPGDRIWIIACRSPHYTPEWGIKKKVSGIKVLERYETVALAERILHDIDLQGVMKARQRGVTVPIIWPLKYFGGTTDFGHEFSCKWKLHGETLAYEVLDAIS